MSQTKLIAEPWDIGPGGYQLGNFPAPWSEWNDNYRDTIRRFWRGEPGHLPVFARRLHGSSDIFEHSGRLPSASINYITSHDGFTLRDLVSYQHRHNLANGENGDDGHRENLSENFGAEGPTDDAVIEAARRRQQRNLLATLLLSQGVPMILAGDELGRSQRGNNNAYCQDNELNWVDWRAAAEGGPDLNAYVTLLLKVRREYPLLSHSQYIHSPQQPDGESIQWLNADGQEMREEDWQDHHTNLLGYLLTGRNADNTQASLLVVFNASTRRQVFQLPDFQSKKDQPAQGWQWLVDTNRENGVPKTIHLAAGEKLQINERSVAILCCDYS